MKAVVYTQYGDPDVLTVKAVDKPMIQEDEVLISVKASGINPVDTYFRKGIREVDAFPHIPHFDLAGEVVEVGHQVTDVKPGERIWATNAKGASADFAAIPAHLAFPLPPAVSYEDGAALAMAFSTAHLALFYRGQLQKGETVLIYGGAGAVGHAAIQLAKQADATIIATASSSDKAAIAHDAGADYVVNYREEDLVQQVMKHTDGNGVPLILDVSLSENMEKDFEMITVGGRIVTIGSPADNTPPLAWRELNKKNAALLGILLFTAPKQELLKAGKAISEGFAQGALSAHLGHVFSLEEASQAHQALENKQYSGSLVLTHQTP